MPLDDYQSISLSLVLINRAERQRRVIDVSDLLESIRARGVFNPIIIKRDGTLVAGERRLEASKALHLPSIPYRYLDDLDPVEAQIIELEENLKRKDLPWRDEIEAIGKLHELFCQRSPEWSSNDTGQAIGIGQSIHKQLRVFRDLGSARIASASGWTQAYTILARLDERREDNNMNMLAEALTGVELELPPELEAAANTVAGTSPSTPPLIFKEKAPEPRRIIPASESILQESFLSWAPSYSGPRYNFIHCDFPFGIEAFKGGANQQHSVEGYADTKDIYLELLDCFCLHRENFLTLSAHVMFWFSFEYYQETLALFAEKAPELEVQTFPLIWFKSDNVGMIPDVKRQPRRVYETALLLSRGGRMLTKNVANCYAAPTNKTLHPSTKPIPMLKHFFQLFVDGETRMLDPTSGSGSALQAAEALGAAHVLGLEKDEEYVEGSRTALQNFRTFREFA